jgi:glycosyltransferase involved in cell wall biosynthesis
MLVSSGEAGPDIRAIPLAGAADTEGSTETSLPFSEPLPESLPMVLCVGSHEPRKNHLAVLHAAEVLWRHGRAFSLLFLGGYGWKGERFEKRVGELQEQGRPVAALRAVDDVVLHAAYRKARFLVFPSLNEGFGLPVAEALAHGTPVITTDYGSTREIVEDGGGGLLVDPRDDGAIITAMERMLLDDALREGLAVEARARQARSWDDYAADTWVYFTST